MPDDVALAAKPYDYRLFAIATTVAAGGGYFVLVGFDLAPAPGRINGPDWLGTLCGLAFFLAGIALALRAYLKMDDRETDVPADAPRWAKIVFWLTAVGITVCLASAGSWVAFGGGERHFSMSGFITGPANELLGRVMFGLGAVIAWIIVAVFARVGARRIFGK